MNISIRRHAPLVGAYTLCALCMLAVAALAGCGGGDGGGETQQTADSVTSGGGTSGAPGGGASVAATPTFSVPAGVYASAQWVGLSCSTPSSAIHYTTNGTAPTTRASSAPRISS